MPNSGEPVNPSGVVGADSVSTSPDPIITGLEDKVAAEKTAQGIVNPTTDTPAGTTLTPQEQQLKDFDNQFGDKPVTEAQAPVFTDIKPPVAEASTPVAPLDPKIKTIEDLLKEGPQIVDSPAPTAEATPQPEKTPKDELMEKISKIVDEYSVGTKDKVVA